MAAVALQPLASNKSGNVVIIQEVREDESVLNNELERHVREILKNPLKPSIPERSLVQMC